MDSVIFLRPGRYGPLLASDPPRAEEAFRGVPSEELPQFHVTLDGKPSDRFSEGTRYCTASLVAKSPLVFLSAYNDLSRRIGRPLVKPSTLRKTRRLKYLLALTAALDEQIKEHGPLPYNVLFTVSESKALDPTEYLAWLDSRPQLKQCLGITMVSQEAVTFSIDGETVSVLKEHFGGMLYWFRLANNVDRTYRGEEEARSWFLYVDKLPSDPTGIRTKALFGMLEYSLSGRLWLSYGHGSDWQGDLLTDIFVNLCYLAFCEPTSESAVLAAQVRRLMTRISNSADLAR